LALRFCFWFVLELTLTSQNRVRYLRLCLVYYFFFIKEFLAERGVWQTHPWVCFLAVFLKKKIGFAKHDLKKYKTI